MPPLTSRQVEIVNMAAQDLADKQIAGALEISFGMVRWHWAQVFLKLNCKTRAGATARLATMSTSGTGGEKENLPL